MSKLLQAILSGMLYTFIIDFFLFLGIQQHYINHYEINLYYNILFADHQSLLIYSLFTLLFGYLIIYCNFTKIKVVFLSLFFLLSASTLIPSIGYRVGEQLLMKKNITIKDNKYTYTGDIYYDGRQSLTFYDYELGKIILLNKKDLK